MAGPHRWIAQTPSSWVAASFSTNLLPANNEKVFFGSYGTGSVIGGLDQSAVDLDLLQVDEGYPGSFGQSGNPFQVAADEIIYRGSGSLHLAPANVDFMLIDSDNLVDAVELATLMPARVRIMRGRVAVTNNVTKALSVEMTYRDFADVDAFLEIGTIKTGTGVCDALRMIAGTVKGPCPVQNATTSSWFQTGGHVVVIGGAMSLVTAQIAAGHVDWEPNVSTELTWSTLHLMAATSMPGSDCRIRL